MNVILPLEMAQLLGAEGEPRGIGIRLPLDTVKELLLTAAPELREQVIQYLIEVVGIDPKEFDLAE